VGRQLHGTGFNRPGVKASEAIIQNWWRQGMMGGAKAHYDGIVAFSQTDFTDDLKKINVPVLVMHGDDDQIVPYGDAGPLSAKLLKNGALKPTRAFRTACLPRKRTRSTQTCSLSGLIEAITREVATRRAEHRAAEPQGTMSRRETHASTI
jgi:dienelactone hydrolase